MEEQANTAVLPPEQGQPNPEQTKQAILDRLAEANTAVINGTASPEQQAMVDVANVVGESVKSESQPQPITPPEAPKEESRSFGDRIVVDDLLGSTNAQIDRADEYIKRNQQEIDTKKGWADPNNENDQPSQDIKQLEQSNTVLEQIKKPDEDMRDYLLGRDYMDDKGAVHDAESGKFKKSEDANPTKEGEPGDKPLDQMELLGKDGLVGKWADAEDHEDKTTSSDVQDEIFRRIEAEQGMTDEGKTKLIDQAHAEMEKLRSDKGGQDPDKDPAKSVAEMDEFGRPVNPDKQPEPKKVEMDEFGRPVDKSAEEKDPTQEYKKTPGETAEQKRHELDEIINKYAEAKIAAEKFMGGKKQKEALNDVAAELKKQFDGYITREMPEGMKQSDDLLQTRINDITAEKLRVSSGLTELLSQKNQAGDNYNGELDQKITDLQAELSSLDTTQKNQQEVLDQRKAEKQAFVAGHVMALHQAVDQAVYTQRVQKHPRLSKVTEWMKRHPKTRMATGLALSAAGYVGTATFNAPLVVFSSAAKGLLSGYGGYEFTRGLAEKRAAKRMKDDELQTVDLYLQASERESDTRRRSKRVALAVGSIVGGGSVLYSVIDHLGGSTHHGVVTQHQAAHNALTANGPAPGSEASLTATTPAVTPLDIQPVDGNTLPWDYAMQNLNTNISAPDTLNSLVNNSHGISFVGNGLSGGQGAFESVTIPGMGTFTDSGHVNAAIQYLLANGG